MSSAQLEFSPESYRRGGEGLEEAATELVGKAEAMLGSVSDLSVLGNDDVGSLMQMVYSAVLERVGESVQSAAEAFGVDAEKLRSAADAYDQTEQGNADATQTISTQSAQLEV